MIPHLITPEQRVPQARQALTDTRSFLMSPRPKKLGPRGTSGFRPDGGNLDFARDLDGLRSQTTQSTQINDHTIN